MQTVSQSLIRIVRGKSRFPLRVVDTARFLMGAGNCCQLKLSAVEIPMIYAILNPQGESCEIEAIHAQPPLFVNGVQQRTARLLAGDRFCFGPYEFEFLTKPISQELPAPLTDSQSSPANARSSFSVIPELPAKIADLSAEELVDRIALELELMEQLGHFDDVATSDDATTQAAADAAAQHSASGSWMSRNSRKTA